eukprot:TRINITY_DN2249_c0_g2_i4.p1 TRINITY_DN2249_c0_g2~~TRINITY_DN2249_c0_g2_i4.p1  ORF type:complete len:474 (-),score=104.67 TRINITY_DN2249_c0_g2_i4:138-1559(-)
MCDVPPSVTNESSPNEALPIESNESREVDDEISDQRDSFITDDNQTHQLAEEDIRSIDIANESARNESIENEENQPQAISIDGLSQAQTNSGSTSPTKASPKHAPTTSLSVIHEIDLDSSAQVETDVHVENRDVSAVQPESPAFHPAIQEMDCKNTASPTMESKNANDSTGVAKDEPSDLSLCDSQSLKASNESTTESQVDMQAVGGENIQSSEVGDINDYVTNIPTPLQLAEAEMKECMDASIESMPSQRLMDMLQQRMSVWGSSFVQRLRRSSTVDARAAFIADVTGTSVYRFLDGSTGSLEDVLLSDDFFDEFEVPRRKLIAFLALRSSMSAIMSYVITPYSPGSLTSKLATVSFDILYIGEPTLLNSAFTVGDIIWDNFFGFLQSPYEQEPAVLCNFSRLVSKFFSVRPKETWSHMKRGGGLKHVLKHINEPFMYELLQSMLLTLNSVQTTEGMVVIEVLFCSLKMLFD